MRAYERLLQYARVYTTSDPESGTHPSAAREFDLAHMLVEEMKNLGIEDGLFTIRQNANDEFGRISYA